MKVYFFNYHAEEFEEETEEERERIKDSEYICVKENRWVKADIAEEMLDTLIQAYKGDIDEPNQLIYIIEKVTGRKIEELI